MVRAAPSRGLLRDPLARRYSVHAGTNLWSEWFAAWGSLRRPEDAGAVREFERLAAERTGCRHAVAFGAGRMALYAILEALSFEGGDEIVVPGFTCTVVPNAMLYRGLRPIYADIEAVTFNADLDAVEAAISPRTRALYMQHTFGLSCDTDGFRRLAEKHGLVLIEDAAHSLGARHDGRPHGSLGDVGFFSTDRCKVASSHLGGCAVTNDDLMAQRLRAIQERSGEVNRWTARRMVATFLAEFLWRDPEVHYLGRRVLGLLRRSGLLYYWRDEPWTAIPAGYPYPSRLVGGLARIGASQLASLDANLGHRRLLARWLEERLGWYSGFSAERFDEQAWLRYSFLAEDRAGFSERFGRHIDLGIWFPHNIFGREWDADKVGYRQGSCPVAEDVSRHVVNFPTHARIPLALYERLWDEHGCWLQRQIRRPA